MPWLRAASNRRWLSVQLFQLLFHSKQAVQIEQLEGGPTWSNVIKLAAKEEAAEDHRIPKEILKELIRKKKQQEQTEAAPTEKGYRKGQRAEA